MRIQSRSDVLYKAFLEECFSADFEKGELTWRYRPRNHFVSDRAWSTWNANYAWTLAGSTSWRTKSYLFRRVTINRMYFPVHHILWVMYTGEMFDTTLSVVDHIDNNPLNNAITNLRVVTQQQNMWNTRPIGKDSSEFKGVCFDENRQKWLMQIRVGSGKLCARFTREADAAYLYRVLSEHYHGEFSSTELCEVGFDGAFMWNEIPVRIRKYLSQPSDSLLSTHEAFFEGLLKSSFKKKDKRTNTGVTGVTLISPKQTSERDMRKFVSAKNGIKKSFAVSCYGYDEAFRLACEWRDG